MEEIKFRGQTPSGYWSFGGYYYDKELEEHRIILDSIDMSLLCESIEVIPESVGISTGEIDTKGVELYSGHIIKCPKGRNDVIEFKNAGFWLKHRNCTLHHFLYTLRSEVEVIGNIHINPELDKL